MLLFFVFAEACLVNMSWRVVTAGSFWKRQIITETLSGAL